MRRRQAVYARIARDVLFECPAVSTLLELIRSPIARLAGQVGAYAAMIAAFAVLDVYALHRLAQSLEAALPLNLASQNAAPAAPRDAPLVTAAIPPPPSAAMDPAPIGPSKDNSAAPWSRSFTQTYRTMCVRLCDGYFFPVSFATSPEFFENDEAACQASCASPARLYVFKNPGETAAAMENLAGRPYLKLETAYKFRTNYDAACTCKGQPWDEAARDRHRVYALRDATRRGKTNKDQKAELAQLDSKIDARLRQTKAAYRVAGVGYDTRRRDKAAAARYKTKTRLAMAPARKQAAIFPGFMGLGASDAQPGASKKIFAQGKARRREATVGDMLQRTIGGL